MAASARMTLEQLNALDRTAFVQALGGIYEHSPWVAEAAWPRRPYASLAALHAAMDAAVAAAGSVAQLALIRAHPDLAGRLALAKGLTADSTREQGSAGLDRLTADELKRFTELNDSYKAKFGFPFIMAVKGSNRHQILAAFEERIHNTPEQEFQTALAEINKIAMFRLQQL